MPELRKTEPAPKPIPPTLPELQALGLVETYSPKNAVKGWIYYRSARKHEPAQRFADGFNGPFPKVLTRFARGETPEKAREFSDACGPSVIAWDLT